MASRTMGIVCFHAHYTCKLAVYAQLNCKYNRHGSGWQTEWAHKRLADRYNSMGT